MAKRHCPDQVMGIVEDGVKVFDEYGAAMLLTDIGEHYSSLNPHDILASLETLHSNNILHGDVRLENVLNIKGKPVWIDFAESYTTQFQQNKEHERNSLLECLEQKFGYRVS